MKNILALLLIIILAACSSSVKDRYDEDKPDETKKEAIEKHEATDVFTENGIKLNQLNVWVDLMPGGRPKFHLSGNISKVLNEEKFSITKINILQNANLVYIIKPTIREDKKEGLNNYMFSTIRGLIVDKSIDIEKHIAVEFVFELDGDSYSNQIVNVKIEKVY